MYISCLHGSEFAECALSYIKNLVKGGAVGEVILPTVIVVKFFENLSIVP